MEPENPDGQSALLHVTLGTFLALSVPLLCLQEYLFREVIEVICDEDLEDDLTTMPSACSAPRHDAKQPEINYLIRSNKNPFLQLRKRKFCEFK